MTFARPLALLVALAVAFALALLYRRLTRRRAAQSLAYSNVAFALQALRPARWPAALLFACFVLGTGALLVALAGPRVSARVPAKDGMVVICIDTSGSMRARDVAPTRADAALAAARAFIDAVPAGTRVGVVSFSTGANLIAAPTADLDAVRSALDRIPPPDGATAIGDALEVAGQQMTGTGRRIIVLLTDGVNNRGVDPIAASQAIGARGVTIETVGVGSSGSGEIIPGTNEPADLDGDALRAIAQNGRGRYVEAADAGALRAAFQSIALGTVWEKKRVDGSFPFAFGGGALLLCAFIAGLATGRIP
ncbi:MAG: VWA domain-containing protein [Candidatus Eremiobacteraeota bacterium]|nr:VWA domain-containing protein [Candidatus Eremiobacteraeota bacterium]